MNSDQFPHRNLRNYDPYSMPVQDQTHHQQPNSDIQIQMVVSQLASGNPVLLPFPEDINQIKPVETEEVEKGPNRMYWTQRQEDWLRLTYNMNPLDFVTPDLFGSANMSIRQTNAPIACIFLFAFKIMILILYFVYPYMLERRALISRLMIFLGALDFWIVKNYCGRILVGLRWWVEIEDDGKERWIFETRLKDDTDKSQLSIQKRLFWLPQFFLALMFVGILISTLVTKQLDLMISISIPTLMICFNLWAFNMCNRVKKSRMGNYMMRMSSDFNKKSCRMPLKLD